MERCKLYVLLEIPNTYIILCNGCCAVSDLVVQVDELIVKSDKVVNTLN